MSERYEVIPLDGAAWTLIHVGKRQRDAFVAWVKLRALEEIQEDRQSGRLDGLAYREALAVHQESRAAGNFDWRSPEPRRWGSAISTALAGRDGKLKLLQILLADRHGQLPDDRVEALFESDPDGALTALFTCLGLVDPNGPAPTPTKEPEKTVPADAATLVEVVAHAPTTAAT